MGSVSPYNLHTLSHVLTYLCLSSYSHLPATLFCKNRPGHEIIGNIHVKQIYEIAAMKQKDAKLSHLSVEAISRSIAGSCQSMGVSVVT